MILIYNYVTLRLGHMLWYTYICDLVDNKTVDKCDRYILANSKIKVSYVIYFLRIARGMQSTMIDILWISR
jgi:hypothetical protein